MSILKLKPACKDYLWGGHRLAEEYGIKYDGPVLAEAWELSCHPDGPSVIANGSHAGKTLRQYIEEQGKDVIGTHCRRFRDFPILIKFIDAKQNLSIQVHPDNRFALKNEGQYGKTEMWYVMDAKEGAFLYYGFKREVSREEFERRIREDTLLEVLNPVPVQKGDVLFIESGTIHAIGKDIMIAEIQQNSNVTYRVYDYGRVGKDGKKRDLHIEKALAVTNRVPIIRSGKSYPHVADCDYFTVDKLNLDGSMMKKMEGVVTEDSFVSILVLDGKGKLTCGSESISYEKGDSLFLTAGSGAYQIEGGCDALVTTIREKAGPVRAGVDIGGRNTKLCLLDADQKFLDYREMPFDGEKSAEENLTKIAETILTRLEEKGIAADQCVGVGAGIAGTVQSEKGMVTYSNNIGWKQVPAVKILSSILPVPVRIANNADCAALGEAAAGAARGYQDVLMLTVGRGVGSGIILNGRIWDNLGGGSAELGHMVIVENGKPCTCGRKGCLEAYVSAAAVRKETKEKLGRALEIKELFALAEQEKIGEKRKETFEPGGQKENGEKQKQPEHQTEGKEPFELNEQETEITKALKEEYIRRLGTGLVNMTNIFRPQAIILGGNLTEAGESWLEDLRAIVERDCFGGRNSEIPEIETARLRRRAGAVGAANLV